MFITSHMLAAVATSDSDIMWIELCKMWVKGGRN